MGMVFEFGNTCSFSIEVRSAAATCLKNILATKTGHAFWETYKSREDPMLTYLQPFRTSKKKVLYFFLAHKTRQRNLPFSVVGREHPVISQIPATDRSKNLQLESLLWWKETFLIPVLPLPRKYKYLAAPVTVVLPVIAQTPLKLLFVSLSPNLSI